MSSTPDTLNEFEMAILRRLAAKLPALDEIIPRLRVLSRELTGCGSYTNFEASSALDGADKPVGLSRAIDMPGVAHGMDGILFFKDRIPAFLEVVAFGGEAWDGRYEGFSIPPDA